MMKNRHNSLCLFFNIEKGDVMKIYLDYLLLVNILFDFILLTSTSLILKRNVKLYRIILGSICGGFTFFILFISLSNLILFLFKMLLGLLMVIITFNFKNIKYTLNNFIYLLINSIILGGGLYLFNISKNYTNDGLIFFNTNKTTSLYLLLIIGSIIIFLYTKAIKKYNSYFKKCYKVDLYISDKIYKCNGYLDTGNRLIDPYSHKPIILTSNKNIKFKNVIFVPYKSLNNNNVLKCMKIDKIYIEEIGFKYNVMLGKSELSFGIEGVDLLLNDKLLEENK